MRNLNIEKVNDSSYLVIDEETGKHVLEIICIEPLVETPVFIDSNAIQLLIKED